MCSAWKFLKMMKSESETSSLLYSALLWWCQSTLTWSERKLSLKSMCLWLYFLLISQFWTVLSRIVQRSAWSFNIHCVSVFWWSCSSYHMLECTLLSYWWFDNFFSFIAHFWQFSYTSSFILLWLFHMILLKEWKSWWFSSMHPAVTWYTHLCINVSSHDSTVISTFILLKYWWISLHSLSFSCNAIFALTLCRLWDL